MQIRAAFTVFQLWMGAAIGLKYLPREISYMHNDGPGPLPGAFADHDGPSTNACAQSAAGYLGRGRSRHPFN